MALSALCRISLYSISEYKAKHKMNCAEPVKVRQYAVETIQKQVLYSIAILNFQKSLGVQTAFDGPSSLDFQ
ncbi:MAG: hypothetical protein LAO24_19650 [Acidobacteriia bacterium]|nr:hypothetical protein [Terriglobia bacterium]